MNRTDVLEIIWKALLRADNPKISDLDTDTGVDGQDQIVLTTEDEQGNKQVWILDDKSLIEQDAEYNESPEVEGEWRNWHFADISQPGYGILLLTREELYQHEWYLPDPNHNEIFPNAFNIINEDGLLLDSFIDEGFARAEYLKRLDATHD